MYEGSDFSNPDAFIAELNGQAARGRSTPLSLLRGASQIIGVLPEDQRSSAKASILAYASALNPTGQIGLDNFESRLFKNLGEELNLIFDYRGTLGLEEGVPGLFPGVTENLADILKISEVAGINVHILSGDSWETILASLTESEVLETRDGKVYAIDPAFSRLQIITDSGREIYSASSSGTFHPSSLFPGISIERELELKIALDDFTNKLSQIKDKLGYPLKYSPITVEGQGPGTVLMSPSHIFLDLTAKYLADGRILDANERKTLNENQDYRSYMLKLAGVLQEFLYSRGIYLSATFSGTATIDLTSEGKEAVTQMFIESRPDEILVILDDGFLNGGNASRILKDLREGDVALHCDLEIKIDCEFKASLHQTGTKSRDCMYLYIKALQRFARLNQFIRA